MVTAQRPSGLKSSGRDVPSCHCMLPAARNSLVFTLPYDLPPMMKTPTDLRVATAALYLGLVRSPILLSSQRWELWSRTRQEAVVVIPATSPPQVAMTGLGSDVKNVTWSFLLTGKSGGVQPVVLGKTSTEERDPPWPDHPPVIKRTFSSVLNGASLETPVYLCMNSVSIFAANGIFKKILFSFAGQVDSQVGDAETADVESMGLF